MSYYKKLVGEKCYLSPPHSGDAEKWTVWLNDLQVTVPLGDEAYTPLALDRVRAEIDESIRLQHHVFSIVECATDKLIGRCGLFGLDLVNRSAMLGIFIGDKAFWNRGYGQEATVLLLDYGFNLLNLHNIMLGVYAFNARGIGCYHKVGFKEIGRRRQSRIICGKLYDEVMMDILEEEFRATHPSRVRALSS